MHFYDASTDHFTWQTDQLTCVTRLTTSVLSIPKLHELGLNALNRMSMFLCGLCSYFDYLRATFPLQLGYPPALSVFEEKMR